MDYAALRRGSWDHELEIHPLLAIFTLMVGGAVGGIVGIYLSVPLVAAFAGHLPKVRVASGRCDQSRSSIVDSRNQEARPP